MNETNTGNTIGELNPTLFISLLDKYSNELEISKWDMGATSSRDISVQVQQGNAKQLKGSQRNSMTLRVWNKYNQVGITTTSEEDDFCEGLILEEGDVCEGPLTDDEGNDIYVWDFEEDLYFTDGDFTVTYLYQENNITMADTGGSLNYVYFSGIPLFWGHWGRVHY